MHVHVHVDVHGNHKQDDNPTCVFSTLAHFLLLKVLETITECIEDLLTEVLPVRRIALMMIRMYNSHCLEKP